MDERPQEATGEELLKGFLEALPPDQRAKIEGGLDAMGPEKRADGLRTLVALRQLEDAERRAWPAGPGSRVGDAL